MVFFLFLFSSGLRIPFGAQTILLGAALDFRITSRITFGAQWRIRPRRSFGYSDLLMARPADPGLPICQYAPTTTISPLAQAPAPPPPVPSKMRWGIRQHVLEGLFSADPSGDPRGKWMSGGMDPTHEARWGVVLVGRGKLASPRCRAPFAFSPAHPDHEQQGTAK